MRDRLTKVYGSIVIQCWYVSSTDCNRSAEKDDDNVCRRNTCENAGGKGELGEIEFTIQLLRTNLSINVWFISDDGYVWSWNEIRELKWS